MMFMKMATGVMWALCFLGFVQVAAAAQLALKAKGEALVAGLVFSQATKQAAVQAGIIAPDKTLKSFFNAVVFGRTRAVEKLLAQYPVLARLADVNLKTPLMYAADMGRANMVTLLVRAVSPGQLNTAAQNNYIHRRDNTGKTALMMAVQAGNTVSVRVLVNFGADCGIADNAGLTAEDLAGNNNAILKALARQLPKQHPARYYVNRSGLA